jgi:site-specific recombinase XerD
MNIREAIKGYLLDAKIEPQTAKHIAGKQRVLETIFAVWCEEQGATTLEQVTPTILKGFVVSLQERTISEHDSRISKRGKRLSPVTVRDYSRVVRAFFSWCEREGYLEGRVNPMRMVPQTKVPSYIIPAFTPQQMQDLLAVCDLDTAVGFRNYTMLLVLMDTGIRVSELCTLKLAGVHEDYLTVFGKGSKEREVGLSPTTARALWKYIHQFRPVVSEQEQRVFLTRFKTPFDHSYVWKVLREIGEDAGVEGVRISPHTLRHSFAKQWLANGGELIKLSRVMGHTDIETTQVYLKDFTARDARGEHTRFSPVSTFRLGRKSPNVKKRPDA